MEKMKRQAMLQGFFISMRVQNDVAQPKRPGKIRAINISLQRLKFQKTLPFLIKGEVSTPHSGWILLYRSFVLINVQTCNRELEKGVRSVLPRNVLFKLFPNCQYKFLTAWLRLPYGMERIPSR